MSGFADVILRGLALVCASLALGGVAWLRLVLRAEPHTKPDAATRLSLHVVAVAAAGVAATQVALMGVALTSLAESHGAWPIARYFETAFARVAVLRAVLGLGVAALAWTLARGLRDRPEDRRPCRPRIDTGARGRTTSHARQPPRLGLRLPG